MFSILNYLYEKNKIINMLLKHDAIIYGPFIRDVLSNQFDEQIKCSYNLNVIVSNNYQKIIERNLYNVIEDKINYNLINGPFKGGDKIDYILKPIIKSKTNYLRVIRIYYITEILSFEKNGLLKESQKYLLLDINSIGITRNGIKIIGQQEEVPNPFYTIFQNIYNKEFSIVGKIKNKYDLDVIYDYLDSGWKLKKRKIIEKTGASFSTEDKCNICMDTINITDSIYKLPCKHFYHKECWKKNVYEYLKNYYSAGSAIFDKNKMIKCPYCRKEYKFREML